MSITIDKLLNLDSAITEAAKQAAPNDLVLRAILEGIARRTVKERKSHDDVKPFLDQLSTDQLKPLWSEEWASIKATPIKYGVQPNDLPGSQPALTDLRLETVKKMVRALAESPGFLVWILRKEPAPVSSSPAELKLIEDLRKANEILVNRVSELEKLAAQMRSVQDAKQTVAQAVAHNPQPFDPAPKPAGAPQAPSAGTYSLDRLSGAKNRCWLRLLARASPFLTRNFHTLDATNKTKEEDAAMQAIVDEMKVKISTMPDEQFADNGWSKQEFLSTLQSGSAGWQDVVFIGRVALNIDVVFVLRRKHAPEEQPRAIYLAEHKHGRDFVVAIWTDDKSEDYGHFDILVRDAQSAPRWRFEAADYKSATGAALEIVTKIKAQDAAAPNAPGTPPQQPLPQQLGQAPVQPPQAQQGATTPAGTIVNQAGGSIGSGASGAAANSQGPPSNAKMSGGRSKDKRKRKGGKNRNHPARGDPQTSQEESKSQNQSRAHPALTVIATAQHPGGSPPQTEQELQRALTGAGVPKEFISRVEAMPNGLGFVVRSREVKALQQAVAAISSRLPFSVMNWQSGRGTSKGKNQAPAQLFRELVEVMATNQRQSDQRMQQLMSQSQEGIRAIQMGLDQLARSQFSGASPASSHQASRTPSPTHVRSDVQSNQASPVLRAGPMFPHAPQFFQQPFRPAHGPPMAPRCPSLAAGHHCQHTPQCLW
jgi:hypothetical protein